MSDWSSLDGARRREGRCPTSAVEVLVDVCGREQGADTPLLPEIRDLALRQLGLIRVVSTRERGDVRLRALLIVDDFHGSADADPVVGTLDREARAWIATKVPRPLPVLARVDEERAVAQLV